MNDGLIPGPTKAPEAGTPSPAQPSAPTLLAGVLLLDKPARLNVSSASACRQVKKRLMAGGAAKGIKIGHAGTLDPLASGLLIIMIGRAATRLSDSLMAGEKTYEAAIDLSHSSATDDSEGDGIANPPFAPPERETVLRALEKFTGTIQQRPPDYSAMLVAGVRAYALARRGKETGLVERPVTIHSIELMEYLAAESSLTIRVNCGKGTYIRSLARDLGVALTGHAARLAALRRTRIGPYSVDDAVAMDALPERITQADLIAVPACPPPTPPRRTSEP